jgi:putative ABC transport system substrate-binding protein
VRCDLKDHIAVVLLVAAAALTIGGWAGEAWSQTNVKRVGILSFSEVADQPEWKGFLDILRGTLSDHGWIEGDNVTFEFRSAHGDPSNFAAAASALVGQNVDVLWAAGAPALHAAYAATRTIPIVAIDYTTDPVSEGYVENYGRPGGNVTGVFLDTPEFAGKWFEVLKAMIPDLSEVVILWDPAPGRTHLIAARNIAKILNVGVKVFEVHKPGDINNAFDEMGKRPQAIIILPSPMIYNESTRLAKLALEYRTLAISYARTFAKAGGAIAYGPDDNASVSSLAILTAKILNGANPAKLPVQRPAKVQLIVNLKTAKALGVTIPDSILLWADEVIE